MIPGVPLPVISDINKIKSDIEKLKVRVSTLEGWRNTTDRNISDLLSFKTSANNTLSTFNNYFTRQRTFGIPKFIYDRGTHKFKIRRTQNVGFKLTNIESGLKAIGNTGLQDLLNPLNQAIADVLGLIPNKTNIIGNFNFIKNEFNPNRQNSAMWFFNNATTNLSNVKNLANGISTGLSNLSGYYKTIYTNFQYARNNISGIKDAFGDLQTKFSNLKSKFNTLKGLIPSGDKVTSYGTNIKKLKFNTKLDGSGSNLYFTVSCGLLYPDGKNTYSYSNVVDTIGKLRSLAESHIKHAIEHPESVSVDLKCAFEHIRWATVLATGVIGTAITKTSISLSGHPNTAHGLTYANYYNTRKKPAEIAWASSGYIVNPIYYGLKQVKDKIADIESNINNIATNIGNISTKFNHLYNNFDNLYNANKNAYTEITGISTKMDSMVTSLNNALSNLNNFISRMKAISDSLNISI